MDWVRSVAWVLLVVLVACGGEGARAPDRRATALRVRDLRLPSGLRLILEEDHAAPIGGAVTVIGSGSTADPPGKEGLAHLVEHLVFVARHDNRPVTTLLEQAGAGSWNAFTSFDETTYYAFGPRDALGDFVSLQMLLFQDPLATIDETTFSLEREVVRNELRQRTEMSYAGQVVGEMLRAVFPDAHPYARAPIGSHASLDTLTLEDARGFAREHYRPSNATVVVIGDFDDARVDAMLGERLPPVVMATSTSEVPKSAARVPAVAPPVPAPPPGPLRKVDAFVPAPELWVAWSVPRGYDSAGYLGAFAGSALRGAVAGAQYEDDDIVGIVPLALDGTQASIIGFRLALREGTHPEESLEHALNRLSYMTGPESGRSVVAGDRYFESQRRVALTNLYIGAEDLPTRAIGRATMAHFSGESALYRRKVAALEAVDRATITDYEAKWLTRERARAVFVRPLPGGRSADAPTGLAIDRGKRAGAGDPKFDVASIPKIAVPVGISKLPTVTLPNGLEVVIGRHGDFPIAEVTLVFHGGSGNALPHGAAQVVQQLARSGRPRNGTYADYGALESSSLGSDSYTFTVQTPAANLEAALGVLFDHVDSLEVQDADLMRWRAHALPRIETAQKRPEHLATNGFFGALDGESWRPATAADMTKISVDDANRWIKTTLNAANATMIVVGAIDEARAESAVRRWFGDFRGGARSPTPPAPSVATARRVIVDAVPGATQTTIRLGCTVPPPDARSAVEYRLVAGAVRKRLFETLRSELGLTYGVSGGTTLLRGGTAHLAFWTSVDNAKVAAALGQIRTIVDLDASKVVDDASLDAARWRMAIGYDLGLSTSSDWVTAVVHERRLGFPLATIDEQPSIAARVEAKKLAETLAACERGLVMEIAGEERVVRDAVKEKWP